MPPRSSSPPMWRFGLLSAAGHLLLLGGLAWGIHQSPELLLGSGTNSVEVELVAAAPADTEEQPPEPEAPEAPVTPEAEPDLAIPTPPPQPPRQEPKIDTSRVRPRVTTETGDGSSAEPGRDRTSLRADRGDAGATKPSYLSNPRPVYPESARLARREGTVYVDVSIDASGRVTSSSLSRSSGHSDLDEAALVAVRRWRFSPARIGGVPVAASATVPVVFDLRKPR